MSQANLQLVLRQYGFPGQVMPLDTVNQLHVTDKTPSGGLPAAFSGVSGMHSGNYMGGRLGMIVPEGLSGLRSPREHDLAAIRAGMARHSYLNGLGAVQYLESVGVGINGFRGLGATGTKGDITGYDKSATVGAPTGGAPDINWNTIIGAGLNTALGITNAIVTKGGSAGTTANAQQTVQAATQQSQPDYQALILAQQQQNQQANAARDADQAAFNKKLMIGGAAAVGVLALVLLLK